MRITRKVRRPLLLDYFIVESTTARVCSHDECDHNAPHVEGYYLVGPRRVRVWVCKDHWSGNPLLALPTPPSVIAAEEAEAEHLRKMEKKYRMDQPPEFGVSVKIMAGSGIGPVIPNDRVASWRWGMTNPVK